MTAVIQGFQKRADTGKSGHVQIQSPVISLSRERGDVRGSVENFALNRVTGTASAFVPTVEGPGRSRFVSPPPLLNDSNAGIGSLGCSWSVSPSTVSHNPYNYWPACRDGIELDVFIRKDVEDLMTIFRRAYAIQPHCQRRKGFVTRKC